MEIHLKFRRGEQKQFIEKAIDKSNLNIEKLARLVSISPRNFRDWKRERFCITRKAALGIAEEFKISLPEDISILEKRWKQLKSLNGKIGGVAFKKLYGNPATPEGRAKGGRKTLEILRAKGIIPSVKTFNYPPFSPLLAEFVGISLGDGGITNMQLTITLNREADRDYIVYVKNLCNQLFGEYPHHFCKKECLADSLYYNGVNLVKYLTEIGLKVGNKVKQQVGVPAWIKGNKEYCKLCCRGLMDTDGCIVIHRYYVGKKRYIYKKLIFTNHSVPLANFVYSTLLENGLHPKMVTILEKRRVWLYNSSEVQRYLNIIGSSNQRLLKFKEGE